MLLAIDEGNTNTLFAVHDGENWIAQWRTATHTTRTADEYAVWLSALLEMEKLTLANLSDCIISSVVPQSLFNLRNLARRYIDVQPLVIGEEHVDRAVEVVFRRQQVGGAEKRVRRGATLYAYVHADWYHESERQDDCGPTPMSWHLMTRPISRRKSGVSLPAKHYPFDPPDGISL